MKEYVRPIVVVNEDVAEGVFAASGAVVAGGAPGCDSKYMNFNWQAGTFAWNSTAKDYYGCVGCPAYRPTGCGLKIDEAYLAGATSYNVDNGNRMPDWERAGATADRMIDDANGLAY
ncbi:MAG: hypothetical protein IJ282_09580 [Lachnospiraceae bacterium]|nr:hypothetical protein [Lachnospiraceae bacterium]